jgi:hypothetical protein
LTRLQNQNAALNRLVKELESQLNTQDMLQSEVERLQEVCNLPFLFRDLAIFVVDELQFLLVDVLSSKIVAHL